tara:strand:- start:332 stop:457 length:126 start_codon:yes stop_codon:yes gene_type:complete
MTIKPSRIEYFVGELEQHTFSPEQRKTIGEILKYVNDLENQ